jgi:hypothetical protein
MGGMCEPREKGKKERKRRKKRKRKKGERESEWDTCPIVDGWEKMLSSNQSGDDMWHGEISLFLMLQLLLNYCRTPTLLKLSFNN